MPDDETQMLLARLQRLAEDLPGVETGTSYGTPALKVAGKLFLRIKDAQTLVL
ncbi:MAG: MmcQ/YjbR family DNA-binding protein, partial [Shinella sp.]